MICNHFTSWSEEKIKIKKSYLTSWEESIFWQLKTQKKILSLPDFQSFFESIKSNEDILRNYTVKDIDFLSEELHKSKYYAELLKEYLFENIRIANFPNKPSRINCAFFIPIELDCEKYLKTLGLAYRNMRIWEVEIGQPMNLHFADLSLLDCNHFPHQDKIKAAKEYWGGTSKIDYNTEILYRGSFQFNRLLTRIQ